MAINSQERKGNQVAYRIFVLIPALLLVAATAMAQEFKARPADAPQTERPESFSADGLAFEYPGNWSEISHGQVDGSSCYDVYLEADKAEFEALNLDAHVIACPNADAPDPQAYVDYLVTAAQAEGGGEYDRSEILARQYGKHEVLAAHYQGKGGQVGSLYSRHLVMVGSAACGDGWTCYAYTQNLQANESMAGKAFALILETVKYVPKSE
jgi:hypothetical protein